MGERAYSRFWYIEQDSTEPVNPNDAVATHELIRRANHSQDGSDAESSATEPNPDSYELFSPQPASMSDEDLLANVLKDLPPSRWRRDPRLDNLMASIDVLSYVDEGERK